MYGFDFCFKNVIHGFHQGVILDSLRMAASFSDIALCCQGFGRGRRQ